VAHHDEINKAFRRLERREKEAVRKKAEEMRKLELAELEASREAERRRRKMIERITLAITFIFIIIIMWLIWTTKGDLIRQEYRRIIIGITGQGLEIDCESKKYRELPICISRREADESWEGISRNFEGKNKPFSLHGSRKEETKTEKKD
jgi:hypothetical protein